MWGLNDNHFTKWFFPEHSGLSGGREDLPAEIHEREG